MGLKPLAVATLPPARAIYLKLPEPPSANRWWRKWNNRMVLSKEARDYKVMVAGKAKYRPLTGDVGIQVTWTRKRKSGDLDKRLGVLLDALQGVAYVNDSQITRIEASRCDDPTDPGIEVWVSER